MSKKKIILKGGEFGLLEIELEPGIETFKEMKNKLMEKDIDTDGLVFLYQGNPKRDNDSIKDISSGTSIYYYYEEFKKNKKNRKKATKIVKNINEDIQFNEKEEQKEKNEDKKINKKDETEKEVSVDIFEKYSSFIKVLSYRDNDPKKIISKILKNLKEKNKEVYQEIVEKRKKFSELLCTPIESLDLNIVEKNYKEVMDLIKNEEIEPDEIKDKNGKYIINLNEIESKFIKEQQKGTNLSEVEIIFAYIKNKFNEYNTIEELKSIKQQS